MSRLGDEGVPCRLRGGHFRHSLDARRAAGQRRSQAGLADWNKPGPGRRRTGQHLALRGVSRIIRQERRSSACKRSSPGPRRRQYDDSQCTVEFIAEPGPLTLCRVTQNPDAGWHAVVAEGRFEDSTAVTFGGYGWCRIPNLQRLYRDVLLRHFPHHVAITPAHVGNALWEAFGNYLGMNVYHSAQRRAGAVHAATAVLGPCRQSRRTSRRWALDHSGNPKMRSPESIAELESALAVAHERLKSAAGALSGGGTEPFFAAHDALMSAERELAAAKGEQYAVSLDFPVKWDTGRTYSPLCSDGGPILTFYVAEPDPNWDGSYVTVKHSGSGKTELLALVEFSRCECAKLGSPNDEVFEGPRCMAGAKTGIRRSGC